MNVPDLPVPLVEQFSSVMCADTETFEMNTHIQSINGDAVYRNMISAHLGLCLTVVTAVDCCNVHNNYNVYNQFQLISASPRKAIMFGEVREYTYYATHV